ncbi:MAG: hypothetical protein HY868_01435 [Chloroflexi bacterium]|nr:hypothetical protein [Chloroflexota bacterium]
MKKTMWLIVFALLVLSACSTPTPAPAPTSVPVAATKPAAPAAPAALPTLSADLKPAATEILFWQYRKTHFLSF